MVAIQKSVQKTTQVVPLIDPKNITNFNLTTEELQRHILFWVCAAGKNGVTAAKTLRQFEVRLRVYASVDSHLMYAGPVDPNGPIFDLIKPMDFSAMRSAMADSGIGCWRMKSRAFKELAKSGLDLKTCTVDDLETIKGIGPKTARCFLIHSRPDQKLAGLDRHILSFLRDKGYDVPKNTPTGNRYKKIESLFIAEAEKANKTIADFDLEIWKDYRDK